jgi:signal transduction histidine kinase
MTESVKAKLLIADDEPMQLRALCDTLQDQGYEVQGCANGAEALAALQRAPFDLLLADLMMPGMSGIELLRAALAIDASLVGIIMTGEGTIGTAVEAMQSGALDYILKPFKLSAVLPVLGRALTMRHLRRENAALERRVREHAAELESTNRELDAFTRSASHDLRAPLNAVLGFSSLLLAELEEKVPPDQRNWMVQVQQAAQQMSDLIDALMRLSLVGRQALSLQKVDVAELVRGVVEELRQANAQRQVTVRIGPMPDVMADQQLLRQVFVNLLSNAFKYTRHVTAAEIDVRAEPRGVERVFSVRDNGPGFDMSRAERLFHAFQRLHSLEEFEGSGVGLSIVQRVVQRHGGRVWAHSVPGKGASFFFTL